MEVLIFKKINKRINCTIKESHDHHKLKIKAVPICFESQIGHEKINIIIRQANDEEQSNNKHGFNCVSFRQLKFI